MFLKKANSIRGIVNICSDKSITHRSLIIASICKDISYIENISLCDDCLTTIECLKSLGIKIIIDNNNAIVYGNGLYNFKKNVILNTKNSGTTTKLLIALLSAQGISATINGDHTISKRNISDLTNVLKKMNANIYLKNDKFCPVQINYTDKIFGTNYYPKIFSAQTKTGIMFASLYSNEVTTIYEKFITRNHTENLFKKIGINIHINKGKILLNNKKNEINSFNIKIPGDISSAAFLIVLTLLTKKSHIIIKNVGLNHTRMGIIYVVKKMGGNIKIINIRNNNYEFICDIIVKTSTLKGIYIDIKQINLLIDEIPIIAVMASFAIGQTIIKNANALKNKESNRILSIAKELRKAGAKIIILNDGLVIFGQNKLFGNIFESHNDHRIVMSTTILALLCEGVSYINDINLAKISYPNFINDLFKLIS